MSGETEKQVSGWTVDTLKEHIDTKFADRQKLLDERYETQSEAIRKAESATEKRFEGVNEFRHTLSDQAARFMSRDEAIARLDRHDADITAINKRLDLTQGSSSGLDKAWGYVIGAVGLAGGIIAIVIANR